MKPYFRRGGWQLTPLEGHVYVFYWTHPVLFEETLFLKKFDTAFPPVPLSGDSNSFIRLMVALSLLTFPFSPSATSCFTLCLMGPASICHFPHCPLTPLAPPFLSCLVRLGLQLRLRLGTNWGSKECILLFFSLSQWPKVLCIWQAFLHQCRNSINSHLLFLDFQINPSNPHLPIRIWLPPPAHPQSLGERPGKHPQCRESWVSAPLPSVTACPLRSCSVQHYNDIFASPYWSARAILWYSPTALTCGVPRSQRSSSHKTPHVQ